ncbi:dehydrogenase [Laceyella sacchari]|nr:dehydrogenase [Laceyella sacchari]
MKKYDVAIIGGGLSGLVASIYLAKAGKAVAVLEKSDRSGGRAGTAHKNGALFNLGGHALYRGGEAFSILRELGVEVQGGIPNAKGYAMWNNDIYPLPASVGSLLTSKLLTLYGKKEFVSLMVRLSRIEPHAVGRISFLEWAEKTIQDPMARHIFYALCRTTTFANDPDHQLAGATIKQLQRGLKENVLYVDGGWESIVNSLRDQAIATGVTLLNRQTATQIEQSGKIYRLHFADGAMLEVPFVIVTVGPAQTCRLVKDAERTSLRKWREQARPIIAACLDLGLKRLPNPKHHFVIGIDQPVFFTNHSAASRLSEDGITVVHLVKYLGAEPGNPSEDERHLEQVMDLLHPQWRKEVVARQFLPNMTVVHDSVTLDKTSFPGPEVPEMRGLYIAGDGCGHGEMLADAALASGKRAALRIIQEFAINHDESGVSPY